MLKPNFFIVGAPKCGTTSIAHYLSERPDCYLPPIKEPGYFSTDIPSTDRLYPIRRDADYLKLYDHPKSKAACVRIDASTTYLRSEVAVANILKFQPEAKFLAIVRSPVDLAYASHHQLVKECREDITDFRAAWRDYERRKRLPPPDSRILNALYPDIARIGRQVQRLYSLVPEKQRILFSIEDLQSSTQRVYNALLEFLDLEADGRTHFPSLNESGMPRFPRLSLFLLSPPPVVSPLVRGSRFLMLKYAGGAYQGVKKSLLKRAPRERLDPDFREELEDFFRPDVDLLSRITGRDFSFWLSTASSSRE